MSAHCREIERPDRVIARQERELDHRADVISTQADRIAELEGELADAIERGAHFASALRWAVPDSPALLRA
jgi:hypothetical protein